ncbi:MAG: alternate F1F0 ATPase, F1 subunit alpha [Desulfuromonadaceae bacterium]|nr:alternate F1F0 ATPase, F1 subunit alpha [Desulfuromonadaceae bacterium]
MSGFSGLLDETLGVLRRTMTTMEPQLLLQQVGRLSYVGRGIARVRGLQRVRSEGLLAFPGGVLGLAFDLDCREIGVAMLGDYSALQAGDEVVSTDRVLDVAVGEGLLGRVVDPTGQARDGSGPVPYHERRPLERPAPAIMERLPVTQPLMTGIKVVDALVPIGRGQRELILGDRQTGKTTLAVDTILNQHDKGVVCVYCAIGQRASSVASVVAQLRERGAMDYTTVVVAEGDDPPGQQYIAPYAATTIGEYFMEQGRDVLVVYDDLTRHARAYRELSLLLRRPPGREAFPGDIFYIHSRLLERATRLKEQFGGGSLTALPIIETEAQNLAAYIPTNLISITDGQIYLSPGLFQKGLLPAVDITRSVSRVGGKAQLPAYRAVVGDLRLAYAQFTELEAFARFGTRLDDATSQLLHRGRRVRAVLKQGQCAPRTAVEQVMVLHAVNCGLFDDIGEGDMARAENRVCEALVLLPEITSRIEGGEKLDDDDLRVLQQAAAEALKEAP